MLRLANPYLKEHGVKLQINNRIYKALIKIFTIAFLIALIYWSCGFTLYVVFPPMPFLVGYYIMNPRIILGISWCIEAIHLFIVSCLKLDGYLYKIVYGNYNGETYVRAV